MGRNLLLAMAMILLGAVPSKANGLVPLALQMPDSNVATEAPAGFVSFCIRFPNQCASDGPTRIALTPGEWVQLQDINDDVNRELVPQDDLSHYGIAEFWTIASDGRGDCDEYALLKRKKLIDAGYPIRALRLAVVKTPDGERHAVLTVATDHGDYVLDNLAQQVRAWTATGYRWIERQDPNMAWGWERLPPAPVMAGPVAATGEHPM